MPGTLALVRRVSEEVWAVNCIRCAGQLGTMTSETLMRAIRETVGRGGVMCPGCRGESCRECGGEIGMLESGWWGCENEWCGGVFLSEREAKLSSSTSMVNKHKKTQTKKRVSSEFWSSYDSGKLQSSLHDKVSHDEIDSAIAVTRGNGGE